MTSFLIFLIILVGGLIISVINMINPYLFWKKIGFWKDAEKPSNLAFTLLRLGGIITTIVVIYLMVRLFSGR